MTIGVKLFQQMIAKSPIVLCLCFMSVINAGAADIGVYKGELRVAISGRQAGNTLLLQYRTKTREVLRIGVSNLAMTSAATKAVIRLDDRSASLASRVDGGYWNTEIEYSDLNLDHSDYRIEGTLTFYLAGSQQTRNFSVYLKPESSAKPQGYSIDWGPGN